MRSGSHRLASGRVCRRAGWRSVRVPRATPVSSASPALLASSGTSPSVAPSSPACPAPATSTGTASPAQVRTPSPSAHQSVTCTGNKSLSLLILRDAGNHPGGRNARNSQAELLSCQQSGWLWSGKGRIALELEVATRIWHQPRCMAPMASWPCWPSALGKCRSEAHEMLPCCLSIPAGSSN